MGALLDRPNTTKLLQDGELLLPARACDAEGYNHALGGNGTGAPGQPQLPAYWLVKFGGASMQGWRKYQEDRLSCMHLRAGHLPVRNLNGGGNGVAPEDASLQNAPPAAVAAAMARMQAVNAKSEAALGTVSGEGIHMLFLSIFDGHGGANTSQYCHAHFHPFLRARVEKRMAEWHKERAQWARNGTTAGGRRKRTSSASDVESTLSGAAAAAAAATPSRSKSQSSSLPAGGAAGPPPYPLDQAFLTQAFLDFDAEIPLPSADFIPRNPPPQDLGGGLRRAPAGPAPGNNIPHLASGTTASLCIVDLANQHVVLAHIGDSRAVVFHSANLAQQQQLQSAQQSSPQSAAAPESTAAGRLSKKKSSIRAHSPSNSAAAASSIFAAAASTARSTSPAAFPGQGQLVPSSAFQLLYASRDHHPDDPVERARMRLHDYECTFLNSQPPANSRICHLLQRISLNVVRGFGDAWFKLDEGVDQRGQMVCAVPDVWAARFPLAAPAGSQNARTLLTEDASAAAQAKKSNSTVSRPLSPAPDSRCTTPVLPAAPAASSVPVLPAAGETLFVVLASDGIWNSEFPTLTPGVSIHHGAAAAVMEARERVPLDRSMFPPEVTEDALSQAHTAAGRALPPPRPAATAAAAIQRTQSSASGRPVAAQRPPPPDDDDDDDSGSDGSDEERDESPRAAAEALNPDDDEDETDHQDDDDDSAAVPARAVPLSSSSSDEDADADSAEYNDMAVNLAVAQYFFNHATPIIQRSVQAATAGSGSQQQAVAANATVEAPSKPKQPQQQLVAGRRSRSPASSTPVVSPAVAASARGGPLAYSTLVSSALDLLMAHAPLNKNNLKATDNMSALLISITPVGVASPAQLMQQPIPAGARMLSEGDRTQSAVPAAANSATTAAAALHDKFAPTSSLSSLRSPNQHAPPRPTPPSRGATNSGPSTPLSGGLQSPGSPATPRIFQAFTPPIVHQRSLPLPAEGEGDAAAATAAGGSLSARSRSMPSTSPVPTAAPGARVAPAAIAPAPLAEQEPQPLMSPPRFKKVISEHRSMPAPTAGRTSGATAPTTVGPGGATRFAPIPTSPAAAAPRHAGHSGRGSPSAPLVRTHSDASNAPTPFLEHSMADEQDEAMPQQQQLQQPPPAVREEDELEDVDEPMRLTQIDPDTETDEPQPPAATAGGDAAAARSKKRRRTGQPEKVASTGAMAAPLSRASSVADLVFSNSSIANQRSPSPAARPNAGASSALLFPPPAAAAASSDAASKSPDANVTPRSRKRKNAAQRRAEEEPTEEKEKGGKAEAAVAMREPSPPPPAKRRAVASSAAPSQPVRAQRSHASGNDAPLSVVGTVLPAVRGAAAPTGESKPAQPRKSLHLQPVERAAVLPRVSPRRAQSPQPVSRANAAVAPPRPQSVHPAVQRGRRASLPSLSHAPVSAGGKYPQGPPQSIADLAVNGRGGRVRARTATARLDAPPPPLTQLAVIPQPPPVQPVSGDELPTFKSGQMTAAQIAAAAPVQPLRSGQQAQQLPPIPPLPPVGANTRAGKQAHSPASGRRRKKARTDA